MRTSSSCRLVGVGIREFLLMRQTGGVPEAPEVEALVRYLHPLLVGHVFVRIDLATINVLKTYDPPINALYGVEITDVTRRGKWIDIDASGLHVVIHLSRAGWLRYREELPKVPLKPGKGPMAARLVLDDGAGIDLTEAGTQKRLSMSIVRDPLDVAGVGRLGIDVLDGAFTVDVLRDILRGQRAQIKGTLTDQSLIAGVGNAYSDEVLWEVGMSPFAIASSMTDTDIERLHDALVTTIAEAVERSSGLPASDLKDDKRRAMNVHAQTGKPCPRCGDVVREVSFATKSLQYCATCQTHGKPLADRRMSKLLK